MKGLVTLVLCLCVPAVAAADNGLILEDGAELESTHRWENATAATVTAGVLGYESVELFRFGYEARNWDGFSGMDKVFGYGFGALTGVGSIAMAGLAVHDIVSTPVADARDAYLAGDHTAAWRLEDRQLSSRQRTRRTLAWVLLVGDAGLAAYGLSLLGSERRHELGVANLWVGGTGALLSITTLLHTREAAETRTHRQLAVSASPGGISVAGSF